MKTDPLEKWVLENREKFDTEVPSPELWDRIDRPKASVIRLNWKQVAWRAAAVAVIFAASWFIHDIVNRDQQAGPFISGTEEQEEELSPLAKEFMEAEVFYTSQINSRRQQLTQMAGDDPRVLEEIDTELVELDQVYKELKKDLNDNADNEQVIEALIQNYRLKLQILEEMQMLLGEPEQSEKNDDYEYRSL